MKLWLDSEELFIRAFTKTGLAKKVREFLAYEEMYGREWDAGEVQEVKARHLYLRPFYVKMTKAYKE
ncbi:hypothetical protein VP5_043 [Vibrio virus VPMCC5]|nr:hypothetical protein VP5_043 [Vibrio virus VPMCC5]